MSRDELLYNRAVWKQKLDAQRKCLATAINLRNANLVEIENQTMSIIRQQLKECEESIKKHLPGVSIAC